VLQLELRLLVLLLAGIGCVPLKFMVAAVGWAKKKKTELMEGYVNMGNRMCGKYSNDHALGMRRATHGNETSYSRE